MSGRQKRLSVQVVNNNNDNNNNNNDNNNPLDSPWTALCRAG